MEKCLQCHFFYIDNRPISLHRSPGKLLLNLFRQYFSTNLSHSFIYVHIRCSVSVVYDCNLDPAKSEILFEQPEYVTSCFTRFLEKCLSVTSAWAGNGQDAVGGEEGPGVKLLSPPLSSPIRDVAEKRNVYAAVDEGALYKPVMKQSPQMATAQRLSFHASTTDSQFTKHTIVADVPVERDIVRKTQQRNMPMETGRQTTLEDFRCMFSSPPQNKDHQPTQCKDNLRQTRLDEFLPGSVAQLPTSLLKRPRSDDPPATHPSYQSNNLNIPAIQAAVGSILGPDVPDLSHGIISACRPLQSSQIPNLRDQPRRDIEMDGPPGMNLFKHAGRMKGKELRQQASVKRQKSASVTPYFPVASGEKDIGRVSRGKNYSVEEGQMFHAIQADGQKDSINPWTIAAGKYGSLNRPWGINRSVQGGNDCIMEEVGDSAGGRSMGKMGARYDYFVNASVGDGLQRLMLRWVIRRDEIYDEQMMLLSFIPPECDLEEFLLEYCSSD